MARRNDSGMRKKVLLIMVLVLLTGISGNAQEDFHLKKLAEGLEYIRKTKSQGEILNKTVLDWSASGCPKITLMDEIKRDPNNEYKGRGANKFKINQIVTHVYNRQNAKMVSKGDYFNSTEKEVYYSAIEKTIKKKCTVTYTLTGHVGIQDFVFMSFNPKTEFNVVISINEKKVCNEKSKNGYLYLNCDKVKKEDRIVFSIVNESDVNESFVILNHNPQK